jgi:predicted transcriptional regulator
MNLAELIKEKGKTQMEVATFLGVSQALVSKWGSRQCQPSVAEIKGLSKFLCVSVDKILECF